MDNCPGCGKDRLLVGYRHNCIPAGVDRPVAVAASGSIDPGHRTVPATTYKYRDPVKRRAQVAEAMRRYRRKQRETS